MRFTASRVAQLAALRLRSAIFRTFPLRSCLHPGLQKEQLPQCRIRCNSALRVCKFQLAFVADWKGTHSTPDERFYDLQQAAPGYGPPETPKPGQPDCEQDSRGVVVRTSALGEATIPRPRPSGLSC